MALTSRAHAGFALIAVLGLACSGAQGAGQTPASASAAQASSNHVVAEVGGKKITLEELDRKWREFDPAEEARVTQLLYQHRRNVLEQMVGDLLIEEAAAKAGVAAEAFLEQETAKRVKEPTDAEVQQFYDANKDRTGGRPLDELKAPIREFMKGQRELQARAQLVEELKTKSGTAVKLALDPPRKQLAIAAHDPVRGPVTAPITIIEFSDFQCPFCGRVTPTLDKLRAAYPDQIRIVFKDFPLPNHQEAPKASEAAHCANDQGKYWEMHDRLFANQQALGVPALKQHAAALGLDAAKFDECLDSGKYADIVQADLEEGQKLGIQSTPTFFVNGRPVVGAQPYEYFDAVVKEELARGK
jgi:protein-disulfide isomerase